MVAIHCSHCGTSAPAIEPADLGGGGQVAVSAPLTWVYEFDSRRGGSWLCPDCSRANLRSMEAGLDREYW